MRHLSLICCAALAMGGLWCWAGPGFAKGGPGAERSELSLESRVRALEAETAYLRARESALSSYVLANAARGQALSQLAATMRAQGFAQRALPAQSRETLLRGLEAMGVSMQDGLPAPTEADLASLKWLDTHLRAAPRAATPEPAPGVPQPAPSVPDPAPSAPDTSGS